VIHGAEPILFGGVLDALSRGQEAFSIIAIWVFFGQFGMGQARRRRSPLTGWHIGKRIAAIAVALAKIKPALDAPRTNRTTFIIADLSARLVAESGATEPTVAAEQAAEPAG
jgi:hypothetical protein